MVLRSQWACCCSHIFIEMCWLLERSQVIVFGEFTLLLSWHRVEVVWVVGTVRAVKSMFQSSERYLCVCVVTARAWLPGVVSPLRLTWLTSCTRGSWRTMCAVWSVAMRAGGSTLTWTSLWSSDPLGPARLIAAWCVSLCRHLLYLYPSSWLYKY